MFLAKFIVGLFFFVTIPAFSAVVPPAYIMDIERFNELNYQANGILIYKTSEICGPRLSCHAMSKSECIKTADYCYIDADYLPDNNDWCCYTDYSWIEGTSDKACFNVLSYEDASTLIVEYDAAIGSRTVLGAITWILGDSPLTNYGHISSYGTYKNEDENKCIKEFHMRPFVDRTTKCKLAADGDASVYDSTHCLDNCWTDEDLGEMDDPRCYICSGENFYKCSQQDGLACSNGYFLQKSSDNTRITCNLCPSVNLSHDTSSNMSAKNNQFGNTMCYAPVGRQYKNTKGDFYFKKDCYYEI